MKKFKIPESSWLLYLYLPVLFVQILLTSLTEPVIEKHGQK